jgi:membrane protease YdiL (CAAX protease family)
MSEEVATTDERRSWPGVLAHRLSPSEAGRWFLLALVGFLVGQIGSVAAVSLVAALKGVSGSLSAYATAASPPEWYVLSSLVGLWVGFIGAPLVAIRLGPIRRQLGVGFRPIDLWGIPIGVAGQFLVVALYAPFIKHLHNFDAPVKKLTGGSHGSGLWLIAVATVIVAPIAEELFFRGLLFRSLLNLAGALRSPRGRKIGVVTAVIADGVLFALAHGELAQLAGLALFGMVLALVFLKTGRLGMSMAAHMSFNAVAIASLVASSGVILRWL